MRLFVLLYLLKAAAIRRPTERERAQLYERCEPPLLICISQGYAYTEIGLYCALTVRIWFTCFRAFFEMDASSEAVGRFRVMVSSYWSHISPIFSVNGISTLVGTA
jgi:hypothetical protein